MVKRLLNCSTSDFKSMSKSDKLESIIASEGRVLTAEVIGCFEPALGSISNAELAAAFGADILLLNMMDFNNPVFLGIPEVEKEDTIFEIKRLTGRLVGVNLEPVDREGETAGEIYEISEGRMATAQNAEKALKMGADIISLTGNPGTGVTNKAIINSIKRIKACTGDDIIIMAGKMHASGSVKEAGENIITADDVNEFANAGADIILLPAPGTVPGITMEYIRQLVCIAHGLGILTMTAIGTSQESSDSDTIKSIALMCKMTGTDMHHIGDAGHPSGMSTPENIFDYSVAIRGRRHTFARMARSVNR